MGLKSYKAKRNLKISPEPDGSQEKSGRARSFVIQKHKARTLHYDFRIAFMGTLKSWAVPKGLSKLSRDKRLAIQVEDHPLSYAQFEGTIPKGQYGAGEVKIWDEGLYYNITEDENGRKISIRRAMKEGHLEIWLEGKRYKGAYVLHRFREKQWLIIKMKKK